MRSLPRLLVALVVALAGCPSPGNGKGRGERAAAPDAKPQTGDITLFFTTELKGTLEPCGCNSDPLGDLARTVAVVKDVAASRPVALLDGGSTLYGERSLGGAKGPQERLEADLLLETLAGLPVAGIGLGPYDLAAGAAAVRPARDAANVTTTELPRIAPRIVPVGGIQVGVFGVVAPALLAQTGVRASDPAAAARTAIADLRGRGAQLVVGLAHMPRVAARRLAREAPGADLLLVGADAPDLGDPDPDVVGGTTLVTPGNRGQVLARVDLHVDAAGGPFVDAIGPARAAAEIARLEARIARLGTDLARWAKDASADPEFVARVRAERDGLVAERDALRARPLRTPERGSWLTVTLLPVKRRLPCDPAVVQAKRALDKAIGEANVAAARDEKPPAPGPGHAGYAGIEECSFCHQAAVEFWRTTRHAGAWETLEKINKQLNRDCIGCHVTGWERPGGATLAYNELLRDVQCEVCHGPASLHVDANGADKPRTVTLRPAADLCASQCHTPEHSDTFQLEAYLRDVVGKGHGEALRRRLGDGPTGRELRAAALEKAGRALGAGCPK